MTRRARHGDSVLPGIQQRVEALAAAAAVAERRVPGPAVEAADAVVAKARGRLGHGSEHTVVALAGPTGAGKSALFNALVGAQVSQAGALRPTTAETHAAVFGADPASTPDDAAGGLLDWLEVRRRHHVPGAGGVAGLVLLDLPDFDSTQAAHRVEVDRLLAVVDLLVFLVDPEKYADDALHRAYLRPLAGHARVVRVALSKADVLAEADRRGVLDDLARLVRSDGLEGVAPVAVSAVTGEGLEALRAVLAEEVAAKRAVVARLEADVRRAAARLASDSSPDAAPAGGVPAAARGALADALVDASGVGAAAQVVAAQHRRDAALATGWPLLRWVRRWRRAPARDLPVTARSPVARAAVGAALRAVGDAAAADLGRPPAVPAVTGAGHGIAGAGWAAAVRSDALGAAEELIAALDHVTAAGLQRLRRPPRWWRAVGALQMLLLAVALFGGVWLAALLLGDSFLRLDVEPLTPTVRGFPLPTLLLVGGIAAGWLVALLARAAAAAGARRRARAARATLREQVAGVAEERVLTPLDAVLADHSEVARLLAAAVA